VTSPGATAHAVSDESAMAEKIAPRTSNWTAGGPPAGSTNGGNAATNSTMLFGFDPPTTKPSADTRRDLRSGTSRLLIASANARRCRTAWIPR
jgi:hypothetical protein